jgi:hypothetical protein
MTVVGRTGHMENGEYVPDTVTVLVDDPGGWAVTANDVSEDAARERGRDVIEKAKAELREQVAGRVRAGVMTDAEAKRALKEANA